MFPLFSRRTHLDGLPGSSTTRREVFRPVAFVAVLGLLGASCGGGDGEGGAVDLGGDGGGASGDTAVTGTISLPSDATNRCAMVALDFDTTGSNGVAEGAQGSELALFPLVAGTTVEFAFDAVPAGTYFLWGYVDADASASDPQGNCEIQAGPNGGDHLGYFDTGLGRPGSANVQVPHARGMTFDFQLGVLP